MADLVDRKRYSILVRSKKTNAFWDDSRNLSTLMTNNPSKLKKILREGVPDEIRCLVWSKVLKLNDLPDFDRDYARALKTVNRDKPKQSKVDKVPTFGGEFNTERFALSEEGERVVKNILCILAHDFPALEFCPAMASILALLAHHFGPDDLLGAARVLVKQSLDGQSDLYFACGLKSTLLAYDTFGDLAKKLTPKAYSHLKTLEEKKGVVSPFWIKWLNNLCTEILPLHLAFRMMDSYLFEGGKIVFRYGLAAIFLRLPQILQCDTLEWFETLYEREPFSPNNGNDERLSRAAFNLSFSRKDIQKLNQQNKVKNQATGGGIHQDSGAQIDQNQKIAPHLAEPSGFLSEEHWQYIWTWIPKRLRTCNVRQLYNTDRDGFLLKTFYEKCRLEEPQLLVLETTEGSIFGAYLSTAWRENTKVNSFFGNAETFLFTLQPTENQYEWVGKAMAELPPNESEKFKEMSLFLYGDYQYMAVGGGGLHYGLSLDESLTKGTTGTCITFNNPPLTGNITTFEVRNLEVYTFTPE